MVKERVRQRGLHLLGRHSLVDDRDHHRSEDEAGQRVQEGQARLAPLHGVLGALGLRHGDLDHLLPVAVGHPVGLGLEAEAAGGAGAGRTCAQVPVGVAVLVRLHVLLHLQGLDHVQEPLPAVGRHTAQGRPREVLPGQADQVPAREVLQGLTVLGHGVLQQPVRHLFGGPVRHLLHGPSWRGSAVPWRRAHAARLHAGVVRGQTRGAARAPAARTPLSGALGAGARSPHGAPAVFPLRRQETQSGACSTPVPAGRTAPARQEDEDPEARPRGRPPLSRTNLPKGPRAPGLIFPEGAAEDTPADGSYQRGNGSQPLQRNNSTGLWIWLGMGQGLPPCLPAS